MKTTICTASVRATASTTHRIDAGDRLVSGKTDSQFITEERARRIAERERIKACDEATDKLSDKLKAMAEEDEFIVEGRKVTHKQTGYEMEFPSVGDTKYCGPPKVRGWLRVDGKLPSPFLMSMSFEVRVADRFGLLKAA